MSMNSLYSSQRQRTTVRTGSTALLLALALCATTPAARAAAGQEPSPGLDLGRAINLALANDPGIKQAEAARQKAQARLLQFKAPYFPSLKLALEYSRTSPVTTVSIPGFGNYTSAPENNYDYHVELEQELFSFGRDRAKVSAGEWEVKAAESALALTREQVEFQAVQLFYGILLQQQELSTQEEDIRTFKEYLETTRTKTAIGVATDFDSLTIEVKLAEARSARENVAGELAKDRIDLARLLGLESSELPELTGELKAEGNVADTAEMVNFGLEHNPELKAADARERLSRAEARAAARRYFPSLKAGFQYGKKNGYDQDMDKLVWNSAGFIKLEMPLFDLAVIGNKLEADADRQAAAQTRRATLAGVTADIKRALSDLGASKAKMDAEKLHLALAEKAAEQAKVRYDGGLITSLDLLNVQADLSRSRSLYSRAIYEFILARAALNKAAGLPQPAGNGGSL
jgi:outer membrane protein TolC